MVLVQDGTFALSALSKDPVDSRLDQIKIDTTTVRQVSPVPLRTNDDLR